MGKESELTFQGGYTVRKYVKGQQTSKIMIIEKLAAPLHCWQECKIAQHFGKIV